MPNNSPTDCSKANVGVETTLGSAVAMSSPAAHAQAANPSSDPVLLGVMQGAPPPADKRVTKENSFQFPNLRWALRNTRLIAPTANIEHSLQPMPLPVGHAANLDHASFTIASESVTIAEYLQRTYTDGFLVVHQGKIVHERYFDSYAPRQPHAWASMTKSITGLIAALLIEESKLDPQAKLSSYVPELSDTPFGEATIQQNLDMEVPVSYPADLPPDLGLFGAVGLAPRREGAPDTIYDFLKVARQTPNESAGNMWYYQNGSTEAVAWAIRRVTGESWSALVSRYLWQKFAEDDGYVAVDRLGIEMTSGGMHSTLRDAARFGELVRAGASGGSPPFSGAAIRLALKPATNHAKVAKGNQSVSLSKYSYHDYWYQLNDGDGSIRAGGRFGQSILINPKAELTIVKFSSAPDLRPRAVSAEAGSSVPRPPLETVDAQSLAARTIMSALTGTSSS